MNTTCRWVSLLTMQLCWRGMNAIRIRGSADRQRNRIQAETTLAPVEAVENIKSAAWTKIGPFRPKAIPAHHLSLDLKVCHDCGMSEPWLTTARYWAKLWIGTRHL